MRHTALSLDHVAAQLGVTRRTVERWIAWGDMPSFTVGRRRYIPTRAVEQRLDELLGPMRSPRPARHRGSSPITALRPTVPETT